MNCQVSNMAFSIQSLALKKKTHLYSVFCRAKKESQTDLVISSEETKRAFGEKLGHCKYLANRESTHCRKDNGKVGYPKICEGGSLVTATGSDSQRCYPVHWNGRTCQSPRLIDTNDCQ